MKKWFGIFIGNYSWVLEVHAGPSSFEEMEDVVNRLRQKAEGVLLEQKVVNAAAKRVRRAAKEMNGK